MADGQSRARPDLALAAGRQGDRDAGWDHRPRARRELDRRLGGHCGKQIQTGGVRALILRQRQVGGMRQPHDAHLDVLAAAHGFAPVGAAAMRAMSARATSSLDCGGQDSTPAAVTR